MVPPNETAPPKTNPPVVEPLDCTALFAGIEVAEEDPKTVEVFCVPNVNGDVTKFVLLISTSSLGKEAYE